MSKVVRRAEIAKLAGILSIPAGELTYLESCGVDTLVELREQVTDMMFEADREQLARAARAVSRMPVPLVARIAARRIPARLSARVTELLPERRAVKLATRVPADYLADIATLADPKRVTHLLAVVPVSVVDAVACRLERRKDYLSMGRIAAHLSDVALTVGVNAISDEALVATIPFADDVDRILRLLPDERMVQVVIWVDEHDRWFDILHLIAVVGNEQRGRLANILMHQHREVRTRILQTVETFGAWDIFLSLFGVLQPPGRAYFAGLLAQRSPEFLETLVRAAAQDSLWADLSGIVIAMEPEPSRRLLDICERVAADTGNPGLGELVRQLHEVSGQADSAGAAAP